MTSTTFQRLFPTFANASASWRDVLQHSALPGNVKTVIQTVAVHSRLSGAEKRDVVTELIAHFEDGYEQGTDYETLLSEFGDPLAAAKLIRRGKIRNRSMSSKILRGGVVAGIVLVLGYVFLYWYFHRGQARPSVDYLAQLNETAASTPESERAWLVYRDVMAREKYIEGPGGRFDEIYYRNEGAPDDMRLVLPTDGPQWESAVEKLQASQELLETMRKGGVMPQMGLELQYDMFGYSDADRLALFPRSEDAPKPDSPQTGFETNPMFGVLLPHAQSFRNSVRILTVDTRWAIEQRDAERAIRNIEAMCGMANQASQPKFMVGSLIGFALIGMACDSVGEVVQSTDLDLTPEQLQRIQHAITQFKATDLVSLKGEKLFFLDFVQRTYTDDGNGNGRITPAGMQLMLGSEQLPGAESLQKSFAEKTIENLASPLSLIVVASRKELVETAERVYDELEESMFTPYHEDEFVGFEEMGIDQRKFAILGLVFPAVQQVRVAMYRTLANQEGTALAIAAHRYRVDQGRWPSSANDLLGTYIDELPIDPLSGDPLKLTSSEQGVRIYADGNDKDDDGGIPMAVNLDSTPHKNQNLDWSDPNVRPLPAGEFNFAAHDLDGDWVIWPRAITNEQVLDLLSK
ncbi:MAG: hypothetical protein R3C03_08445 [Pirellulaceae bacterium]